MFTLHDFIPLIPLVVIGFVHRQIAKNGAFFLIMSNLPITVMHELAHFTAALLLGGRPSGFSLWPRRENGAWRLGSVTARATVISAAPTALAPLAWLIVAGMLLAERATLAGASLPRMCGVHVAAYLCVAAALPSWQDIRVALMHPFSLLLWSVLLGAAAFATGYGPPFP
jgi:hypothetical protein